MNITIDEIAAKHDGLLSQCLELYDKRVREKLFERRMLRIKATLEDLMMAPDSRVHSIRWRVKSRSHVRGKLIRELYSRESRARQGAQFEAFDANDLFKIVPDIVGARILVLYPDDIVFVDSDIRELTDWRVVWRQASFGSGRLEDESWLKLSGFDIGYDEDQNTIVPREDGYTSIHYFLTHPDEHEYLGCELQVRTVHQEGWGEFSHQLKYPYDTIDPLASRLIKRLSQLLHQAEGIASDIRRFPADARIIRGIFETFLLEKQAPTWEAALPILKKEILARAQHLSRFAPLAAIAMLTGADAKVARLFSLDFGDRKAWSSHRDGPADLISRLYLEAHLQPKRQVRKVFVWDKHNPGADPPVPDLLAEYASRCDTFDFREWHAEDFRHFHQILCEMAASRRGELGSRCDLRFMEHLQFFLWFDENDTPLSMTWGEHEHVSPMRPAYGFFSPSKNPDLLAGVRWLVQPSSRMTAVGWLQAYKATIDRLVEERCIPAVGEPAKSIDDDRLREIIGKHFFMETAANGS